MPKMFFRIKPYKGLLFTHRTMPGATLTTNYAVRVGRRERLPTLELENRRFGDLVAASAQHWQKRRQQS